MIVPCYNCMMTVESDGSWHHEADCIGVMKENLEARIRELEAEHGKWQLEFNQKHADLLDAQGRIERAEAILHSDQTWAWAIPAALAALEGK